MSLVVRSLYRPKMTVMAAALIAVATAWAAAAEDAPFLVEADAAMKQMMFNMDIKPSGDADRDFVAMMIPHHLGAVDMARAELRYGHNEVLRRIAQGIIVEQLQEIEAMRAALGALRTSLPVAPFTARNTSSTGCPAAS